jgi:hypothetical protein
MLAVTEIRSKTRNAAGFLICDHSFPACDHIFQEIWPVAPKNRAFRWLVGVTQLSKAIKRLSGTGKDSDHG